MVEFGGWEMPVQYQPGIVLEHLTTRRKAGLFDVSHMGRFVIRGEDALEFLQHVLMGDPFTTYGCFPFHNAQKTHLTINPPLLL